MGDSSGPSGTAVSAARRGGRGEGLVASDRSSAMWKSLWSVQAQECIWVGLGVDREPGVPL